MLTTSAGVRAVGLALEWDSLLVSSLQVAIEKTHAAVVQIRQRSSALLMAKHYSPEQVMEIESNVTKKWEKLVTCAEDR